MLSSSYLGAWDLFDDDGNPRDRVARIKAVNAVTLPGIRGKIEENRRPVLTLEDSRGNEWPKKLIVNATIGEVIAGMYGPNVRGWSGKLIALYPTTTRGARGGTVDCVRVRPTAPTAKPAEKGPDRPVDEAMRERQMRESGELPAEPPATRQPGEEG